MSKKVSVLPDRLSGAVLSLADSPSVSPEKLSVASSSNPKAWVATVAGERTWGDTRDSWFERASVRSGLPFRTIRAIYYSEITDPEHEAMITLKKAAERREIEELAFRFEQMAQRLRSLLARHA